MRGENSEGECLLRRLREQIKGLTETSAYEPPDLGPVVYARPVLPPGGYF